MNDKVLIVGGVAGGASTAARLRRNDENAEIIMFEKGEYISFANCGLPYYIGGTIKDRSKLLVQTPEKMKARFNIDVRVMSEVVSIDRENKNVVVKDYMTNQEYKESYDKLVLSPGSTPLRPKINGIDSENIFTLWNIPDTDKIKEYVERKKPKRAVVIGGGFIGIEMAENLIDLDMDVSLVEMQNQVMTPIDYEMAQEVHEHMMNHGLNLHLNDGVKSFSEDGKTTIVTLQSGKQIRTDMVILSIGIKPQSNLAKSCNLALNDKGGFIVNEYMQTEDEDIYAIGDAAEVTDFNLGGQTMVPLAGPANKQGRIVANNIAFGNKEKYQGTQGTSIAKVFDLAVANTGVNEKTLKTMGKKYEKDYLVAFFYSKSNAGYYPGAGRLTIKLIFEPGEGKVLGAQVVGYKGVDKRNDVFATVIRMGGTIYDLKTLELSYAPPFGNAKDAVNMVGFIAENILTGKVTPINWDELDEAIKSDDTLLLDVRTKEEYELGAISGAVLIPVDELRDRLSELDVSKKIIIYCAAGLRGYVASRILMQNGFKYVKNLQGGYSLYNTLQCGVNDGYCDFESSKADLEITDSGDVSHESIENAKIYDLDACGLQCPGPILQVRKTIDSMEQGEVLNVRATDPGFKADIKTWCDKTGNELIESHSKGVEIYATIKKGGKVKSAMTSKANKGNTMVVFSGDLDKAIASLIIANGAAAMGRDVTMFFTFWGLNILRRKEKVKTEKDFMGKMFSGMMPRGTEKLGLSKMNFGGLGAKMIKKVMKDNNVDSLDELLESALDNGVKMVACTMSMDLMGITKEEIIDGIDYGGVATYLGAADESDINLFI